MALPCSTSITSFQLGSPFPTRLVIFLELPKDIFSDVDKIMHADFFFHILSALMNPGL